MIMKKYEITKEQIKEYVEQHPCCGATKQTLQDLFPDAFKQEFKEGRWYKSYIGTFAFYSGEENMYGIANCGQWNDAIITKTDIENCCSGVWEEANDLEISEALKIEAVKRGLVAGVYSKHSYEVENRDLGTAIKCQYYESMYNTMYSKADGCGGVVLFSNGEWAEVIPTKTKSEAEKELNCKIVD